MYSINVPIGKELKTNKDLCKVFYEYVGFVHAVSKFLLL